MMAITSLLAGRFGPPQNQGVHKLLRRRGECQTKYRRLSVTILLRRLRKEQNGERLPYSLERPLQYPQVEVPESTCFLLEDFLGGRQTQSCAGIANILEQSGECG